MNEEEQTESVKVEEIQKELAELKLELAEQQKVSAETKEKETEEYNKRNEDIQKSIKTNNDQIKTLSEDITDLKQLIANDNAINPESLTYTVEVSQAQIDKLKAKEQKYLELGSTYVSIFLAIMLTYVGIRGLFSRWKTR